MDIYSLLNIKEDVLQNFPLLANRVADHQVERVINRNTSKLKKIEDSISVDKNINVSQQSIDEVIKKVVKASKSVTTSNEQWSLRELRIVSYYLMKLRGNGHSYYFALALLDQQWRNLFFNGLVFYLINSWHNIESDYREATCGLLVKKLLNYKENSKRYLLLKEHVNFFEPTGPLRLAALVIQKGMNVLDAPSLLGKKSSALAASYFSDVIIKYYKDKYIENFSSLDDVFNIHNWDRTRKLVFANLVAYENNHPDGFRRAKLCQYINRTLGDVTLASTWAPFLGATNEDAQTLKQAMKMVNIWFAQQIIETFFEICVQDKTRKEFWLDYVEYIDGFKIVGSNVIKSLLRSNEKIGSTFAKNFIETNSTTSQTSALVLFMKNKVLVEFSDTGALYVYNRKHRKAKQVIRNSRSMNSTADLKEPSMNKLIESYDWGDQDNYDEGRMSHIGYWQSRLSKWLHEIIINSNQPAFDFSTEEDDNLFKATPLEKETKVIVDSTEEIEDNPIKTNVNSTPQHETANSTSDLSEVFSEKEMQVVNIQNDVGRNQSFAKDESEHIITEIEETEANHQFETNELESIDDKSENSFKSGLGKLKEKLKFKLLSKPNESSINTNTDTLVDKNYNTSSEILFFRHVQYDISSKLFNDNYQIVANQYGFYLYNFFTGRCALLQKDTPKISENDAIWLRKRRLNGWIGISLSHYGMQEDIGYLYFNGDQSVSFKKEQYGLEIKRIENF